MKEGFFPWEDSEGQLPGRAREMTCDQSDWETAVHRSRAHPESRGPDCGWPGQLFKGIPLQAALRDRHGLSWGAVGKMLTAQYKAPRLPKPSFLSCNTATACTEPPASAHHVGIGQKTKDKAGPWAPLLPVRSSAQKKMPGLLPASVSHHRASRSASRMARL